MMDIVNEESNVRDYRDIDLVNLIQYFCQNIQGNSQYDVHGQIQLVRRYDQKVMIDENIGQGLKGDKYLEIYGHLQDKTKELLGSPITSGRGVLEQPGAKKDVPGEKKDVHGRTNKHQALEAGLTEKIVELHEKGMSNVAISKELGISRNTVYNHLKKLDM